MLLDQSLKQGWRFVTSLRCKSRFATSATPWRAGHATPCRSTSKCHVPSVRFVRTWTRAFPARNDRPQSGQKQSCLSCNPENWWPETQQSSSPASSLTNRCVDHHICVRVLLKAYRPAMVAVVVQPESVPLVSQSCLSCLVNICSENNELVNKSGQWHVHLFTASLLKPFPAVAVRVPASPR